MSEYDDVCVLLPTMDEVETVARVVEAFRNAGLDGVLVIDGGSTDGTQEAARERARESSSNPAGGRGRR